jgi:hypothetical protein
MTANETYLANLMAAIAGYGGDIFCLFKELGNSSVSIYAKSPVGVQVWVWAYMSGMRVHRTLSDTVRTFPAFPTKAGQITFLKYDRISDYGAIPVVMVDANAVALKELRAKGVRVYFLIDILLFEYFRVGILGELNKMRKEGVHIALCNYVSVSRLRYPASHEQWIRDHYGKESFTDEYQEHYQTILTNAYRRFGFSEDYIQCCTKMNMLERVGNIVAPQEYQSAYVNYIGGFRVTTGIPENPSRRVFCCGNSVMRGYGVDDAGTIPSALQQYLNKYSKGKFAVYNMANSRGSDLTLIMPRLRELSPQAGDIVIVCSGFSNKFVLDHCARLGFLTCYMTPYFEDHTELGEIFIDTVHMNSIGYRQYAQALFKTLRDSGCLDDDSLKPCTRGGGGGLQTLLSLENTMQNFCHIYPNLRKRKCRKKEKSELLS